MEEHSTPRQILVAPVPSVSHYSYEQGKNPSKCILPTFIEQLGGEHGASPKKWRISDNSGSSTSNLGPRSTCAKVLFQHSLIVVWLFSQRLFGATE